MKVLNLLFIVFSLSLASLVQAQVTVKLTETVSLTFPDQPDIIDTLGQKVFHFSNESGYFACIVQNTNIKGETRANLDVIKFYTNLYESLNQPQDHCKTAKQQEVIIQDLRGLEFYYTCDPNPEVPNLRFKRLLLYESRLFVLDYWTNQDHFSQSGAEKNAFFESFKIQTIDNTAAIPSAFEATEPEEQTSYKWLILILLILPVIYFLSKRKPKK